MISNGELPRTTYNLPVAFSNIMINGKAGEEIKIKYLSKKIYEHIKDIDSFYISNLIEEFNESPVVIIRAVKLLEDDGLVKDVS